MKLNPIAYAIVAAGLVAPGFAAYHGHTAHKSTCGMPTGSSDVNSIVSGNSYNSGVDHNVCWHNRVRLSGDAEYGYVSTSNDELALVNLNIALDAKLSDAWSAKVVFADKDTATAGTNGYGILDHSAVTFNAPGHGQAFPAISEGYIAYHNAGKSPLYMKFGRTYLPFGHGNAYAPAVTQTAAMSLERADLIELGMASAKGWFANASYSMASTAVGGTAVGDGIYTAQVGFSHSFGGFKFDAGASYLSDISQLGNATLASRHFTTALTADGSAYQAHVDTNIAGFDVGATYFNEDATNASIWGANVGYGFNAMGLKHSISVNYEAETGTKVYIDSLWTVGLNSEVSKNVSVNAYYQRAEQSAAKGGASDDGFLVGLKAAF